MTAWKVPTQRGVCSGPSRAASRLHISPAALAVKVMQSSRSAASPARMRSATRRISVSVLPDPAPASTSSGAGVVAAARCAGFRQVRCMDIDVPGVGYSSVAWNACGPPGDLAWPGMALIGHQAQLHRRAGGELDRGSSGTGSSGTGRFVARIG